MNKLVRKRKLMRGKVSRLYNDIEDLLGMGLDGMGQLKVKWPIFLESGKEMMQLDRSVLDLMLEESENEEECEQEMERAQEYQEKVEGLRQRVEMIMRGNDKMEVEVSEEEVEQQDGKKTRQGAMKLPKLKLEVFDLCAGNWPSFWSQFNTIHSDDCLTAEVKFRYLRMCLAGASKLLVDTYPNTSDNYIKAINHLKERFGRDELVVQAVYRELLALVRSRPTLSMLYDTVSAKIRNLEAFGVPSQHAAMLVPLIEDCLPEEVLKLWARREMGAKEDKLTVLMGFLAKEAETDERVRMSKDGTSDLVLSTAAALVSTNDGAAVKGGKSKLPRNVGEKEIKCVFCKANHFNKDCKAKMELSKRRELVKDNRLCFACLRPGHTIARCHFRVDCLKCKGRHYAIVCPGKKETDAAAVLFVGPEASEKVILQTFLVRLGDRVVRVLVDSASHRSYIRRGLSRALGLVKIGTERFKHMLFGGEVSSMVEHEVHSITLEGIGGGRLSLKVLAQNDTICGPLPNSNVFREELAAHGIVVNDDARLPVDILLGADVMAKLVVSVRRIDTVLAVETCLGWCLMGTYQVPESSSAMVNIAFSMFNSYLPSLWELESLGIEDAPKPSMDWSMECVQHFKRHVSVTNEGRYSVILPWIENHPPLPTEYGMAERRLSQVVQRLERNGLYAAYNSVFEEWNRAGIIEEVSDAVVEGHYLPHRPVIRENKTTKIRPVFDASAKAAGKVSLNQCLHTGPNLVSDIFRLLMQFRLEKIGVTADIKQAFLMIELGQEDDRNMLRFLWRKEGRLITYRHCRVVFGLTPSPFLLNAVLSHHVQQFEGSTAERLRESFYVDDCITSLPSRELAMKFKDESVTLMAKAKFDLRGWVLSGDEGDQHVLGLRWLSKEDVLGCCKPKFELEQGCTKKELLSLVGRMYDPLGFLAAPILYLKVILQECFKLKLGWNEQVPRQLRSRVEKWFSEINLIESLVLPRNIREGASSDMQLHVFSDACKGGLGICVFLRYEVQGKVSVSLVTSKARVAPIGDGFTIPRLELTAAVMAARLGTRVNEILNVAEVTYWSDSMIALYWIKKGEWRTWVGNRVREIRKLSEGSQWRFVAGERNPADLVSRGCLLSAYADCKWWEGPEWLRESVSVWPVVEVIPSTDALAEQKVACLLSVAKEKSEAKHWFTYFGSYKKNVRVMGWIYRFIRKSRKESLECSQNLSGTELLQANNKMIWWIQRNHDMNLETFCTKTDDAGLIRIRSKVLSDKFSVSFREPILLPYNCQMVESMVAEHHRLWCHAGVATMLNRLREEFWLIKGRRLVRKVVSKCLRCRLHKVAPVETPSVGLPHNRVNLVKVFQVCGCDLAGPLYLKNQTKVWVVLFTCAVYRCVHLELVDSLTTEAFLLALRRMIARRGRIGVMYSDNGTNLVGAWNLIKRTTVESEFKLQWIFNVPSGAWWGGFWERLIGVMKGLLKATLGRALLTYIELETTLSEVEAIVNARPITYQADDPDELRPITPAMFLQEESTSSTVDLDQVDTKFFNARVKYIAEIRSQLKERFKKEYLGALFIKQKRYSDNVQVGEVVWLMSDKRKRVDWSLARVLELYAGKDGVSRVAKIRTQNGELLRPVQRLCRLEVECNNPVVDNLKSPSTC